MDDSQVFDAKFNEQDDRDELLILLQSVMEMIAFLPTEDVHSELRWLGLDPNEILPDRLTRLTVPQIEVPISQTVAGGELYPEISRDIAERMNMKEELRHLSGRFVNAQDTERQRLARELHDNVNQRVAMLHLELSQLDQDIPKEQSTLHARVQNLRAMTKEISSELHQLSHRLYPSKLDHLGLVAAVKQLCDEVSVSKGLKIDFRYRGFPAELPKDITLCVFRIAQESLHNVIKHSGAGEVLVVLETIDQSVHLSVSDNGCGFDESAKIKGGIGLISMKERLRLVGGNILIHSRPARGTRIEVSVPLTMEAEIPKEIEITANEQTLDHRRLNPSKTASPLTDPKGREEYLAAYRLINRFRQILPEETTELQDNIMKRPRILLADDHTLLVEAIKPLLEPEFEVAATFSDGQTLLEAAPRLMPDVIVLDIGMPILDGLSAGQRLKQLLPNVKLVYLTVNQDPDIAAEAFRGGASGYLLKTSAPSELINTIRDVL